MRAEKLCTNKILQFLTGGAGTLKWWLCVAVIFICLFCVTNTIYNDAWRYDEWAATARLNSRSHTRTTTLHPFNCLFSRTTWVSQYQKGKTSLDLNETKDDGVLGWQWHQLDHMQTVCTSLQSDEHTNTWSLNFYRPNALADAKPTVSKH